MRALVSLLLLIGCTPTPPKIPVTQDFGEEKSTQVGRYTVALSIDPDPPPLGELFVVHADVKLPDGLPVETGRVTLDARMPQHEHGMETRPVVREGACEAVTDAGADTDTGARTCRHPAGRYTADGFKFHMSGKWTVLVTVDGPGGPDSTTFVYRMP